MSQLELISPGQLSPELQMMLEPIIIEKNVHVIKSAKDVNSLTNRKIIFAVEVDDSGFSLPIYDMIKKLYKSDPNCFKNSSAVIFIHSSNQLFTKSVSQSLIFITNKMGCRYIGHPVVEAIEGYKNFHTWQKTMDMSLKDICHIHCENLYKRLLNDVVPHKKQPHILVLHASSRKTSNTLLLWDIIKKYLSNCVIEEIHVENGTINDCRGCSFKTCLHYSKQNSCFYGGIVVEEVFPAIQRSDSIIWICPNYNDAISANLTAVINRLTALYRKISFYDKKIFGVIVSGNSGGDSVAKQLIGALNINKGFRLPPNFAIMEIANDPKSILKVESIESKAKSFAENIILNL